MMEKEVFKNPNKYYLGMIWIVILIGIPIALFIMAIIGSPSDEKISYMVITFILSIILIALEFYILRDAQKGIIITDGGLAICTPFKKIEFCWNEITEFGKVKIATVYIIAWSYYIKSEKFGNKSFFLYAIHWREIDKLCSIIFDKAKNARFVILGNVSIVPFVRRYEIINEWKRDKNSKESIWR